MRPCRSTAAPLTSCDFQSKPQAGPAWEALETLLRTQAQWTENDAGRVDLALARLGALGLDLERLTADMASPGLDRILEQDVRDARTLQVTKTPEYFINGRPLPPFRLRPAGRPRERRTAVGQQRQVITAPKVAPSPACAGADGGQPPAVSATFSPAR
jgi:hypothetical protein